MTIKPPSTNISVTTHRLECFKEKPSIMTDDEWELAKDTALKIGVCNLIILPIVQ
jgi:hypothetical protein